MELQNGLIIADGVKRLIISDRGGVGRGCSWWLAAGLACVLLMKAAVSLGD